jgi:hypothetical protein
MRGACKFRVNVESLLEVNTNVQYLRARSFGLIGLWCDRIGRRRHLPDAFLDERELAMILTDSIAKDTEPLDRHAAAPRSVFHAE